MTDTVPAALLFVVRDKQRHRDRPLTSPTERVTVNGLRRRKKSEENEKSLLRVRARSSRSLALPFDSCASFALPSVGTWGAPRSWVSQRGCWSRGQGGGGGGGRWLSRAASPMTLRLLRARRYGCSIPECRPIGLGFPEQAAGVEGRPAGEGGDHPGRETVPAGLRQRWTSVSRFSLHCRKETVFVRPALSTRSGPSSMNPGYQKSGQRRKRPRFRSLFLNVPRMRYSIWINRIWSVKRGSTLILTHWVMYIPCNEQEQ